MKKQLFITGGLGNQMFEYAFFLACRKKGVHLSLNLDLYNVNIMHNGYMLCRAFGIPEDDVLPSGSISTFFSRALFRFRPFGLVYIGHYDEFDAEAYHTRSPYIKGIFIGERYFADARDEVLDAFSFIGIDRRNQELAARMKKENSVSLHIRRGDYLNHPSYAVCKETYYHEAIGYICGHTHRPKFYVFSDDPDWCDGFMRQFGVDFEIVAHNQGADCYQDMYLMTQCHHNIICNSTFSWWGAYLNRNEGKIVVGPNKWFVSGRHYNPCLPEWVKIQGETQLPPPLCKFRETLKRVALKAVFGAANRLHLSQYMPDALYLRIQYFLKMGQRLELRYPLTFSEKIQWLKLHDRRPEYSVMVDKYAVKQYVADRIGEEYIIPTLGVWNSFDEIDFDGLPDKFVLKCTHDSGGLVICRDKQTLDKEAARRKIEKCLNRDYYRMGREWAYKDVPRRIIAEKFMEDTGQGETLNDYKLMCFAGKVHCSFVCSGRGSEEGLRVTFYDREWRRLPFTRHYPSAERDVEMPSQYHRMIELAERLSKDIPFVRTDFYEIEGNLYFGELTLYPGNGMEEFSPEEWDERLGNMLCLPS